MEQIYDTLPCSTLRVSLETEGTGKAIRLHRGQNAKSAAADVLCGCTSIHFQSFGITQRHIVV